MGEIYQNTDIEEDYTQVRFYFPINAMNVRVRQLVKVILVNTGGRNV